MILVMLFGNYKTTKLNRNLLYMPIAIFLGIFIFTLAYLLFYGGWEREPLVLGRYRFIRFIDLDFFDDIFPFKYKNHIRKIFKIIAFSLCLIFCVASIFNSIKF